MCEILCCDTIKDKAGQHNAERKTVLLTMQNDLLHEFIDKKLVSFCNRFRSCVAATAGH